MAADIKTTRRTKILVHLHENGGSMAIGPLHDWSGLKLLAAHQAFSELMEGLTTDGLVSWDGQIFRLLPDGSAAAAEGAKKSRKKGAKVEEPAEEAAEPEAEPAHDHGHSHDHAPAPKPVAAPKPVVAPKPAEPA